MICLRWEKYHSIWVVALQTQKKYSLIMFKPYTSPRNASFYPQVSWIHCLLMDISPGIPSYPLRDLPDTLRSSVSRSTFPVRKSWICRNSDASILASCAVWDDHGIWWYEEISWSDSMKYCVPIYIHIILHGILLVIRWMVAKSCTSR